MKILDNLATKIADKLNAKNDEVMLLEQENEKLKRDYDAKTYTNNQLDKKLLEQEEVINELMRVKKNHEKEIERQSKCINDLSESRERQVDTIQEYAEQIIELRDKLKKKSDNKLKQRNKELEVLLEKSESLIKANTIYRKTYEYISDEKNRQTIIDNFSHNLSKWISEKNLTDTEVAKKLDTSRNIVGNLRTGKRAVNVNTIQKFDIELCEYFECSVYELVTEKLNKEASQ